MYFNMFVHNNIGGTLKKIFHPPFWGVRPPYISVHISSKLESVRKIVFRERDRALKDLSNDIFFRALA